MHASPERSPRRLSKSRFVAGWRCSKLLWLRVHEPEAPELVPSAAERDRMEQGQEVGRRAHAEFPGGVLVPLDPTRLAEAIAATRRALDAGAHTIYEASFSEDGVFVAADVLTREGGDGGWHLVEGKATTRPKDEHFPDVAVQLHVLRRAGLDVRRATLLHLNPDYRMGGSAPLFAHADVTGEAEAFQPQVPGMIREQLAVIAGPLPAPEIGARCQHESGPCPFVPRCWPDGDDHVRHLHRVGLAKAAKWMAQGIHRFGDVRDDMPLDPTTRRQLEAWRAGRVLVSPGLAEEVAPLRGRVGFLDFETIGRAIPVWPGVAPWGAVPVQWSYHERGADGALTHREWLAEGPDDPRPALARALVAATAGTHPVLAYTGFEQRCIGHLIEAVPEQAAGLGALRERLVDLAAIVRRHVAHPGFGGSFRIKRVLGPLTGRSGYVELAVQAGDEAAAQLARLLLRPQDHAPAERAELRRELLAYCEQDTRAMVDVLTALEALAGAGSA